MNYTNASYIGLVVISNKSTYGRESETTLMTWGNPNPHCANPVKSANSHRP